MSNQFDAFVAEAEQAAAQKAAVTKSAPPSGPLTRNALSRRASKAATLALAAAPTLSEADLVRSAIVAVLGNGSAFAEAAMLEDAQLLAVIRIGAAALNVHTITQKHGLPAAG
jgi:hypothetical protein